MSMTKNDIREMVGGKIFGVSFIKKDNTKREMVCRLKVRSHLRGGTSTNANVADNLVVFDMGICEYRCIPMSRLLQVRFQGRTIDIS